MINMLQRILTRRRFLSLICVTGLLFVVINFDSYQENLDNNIPPSILKPRLSQPFNVIIKEDRPLRMQTTTNTEEDMETPLPSKSEESLPWFITKGTRQPVPAVRTNLGHRIAKLWPQEEPGEDRIYNQLMYIPPEPIKNGKLKKILMYHGVSSLYRKLNPGPESFSECPVSTCTLSENKADAKDADAILFKDQLSDPGVHRPRKQVWILHFLESPYLTSQDEKCTHLVNWTATYHSDSDIVHPYGKWMYYDERVTEYPGPLRDYTANKTQKVAWFVSNCGARNNRLQYAQVLQNYIQVDIYGACGTQTCPRSVTEECFELLHTKYKYYLAFENANCKEYITEKFFLNSLGRNILPIVMGARPEDYAKRAPKNSYIHVDDFASPKELAEYLLKLDNDDDLYNAYFKWKGTGEIIDTHFFCRLCAMLHDDFPVKSYKTINEWWRGAGMCTTSSWRKEKG